MNARACFALFPLMWGAAAPALASDVFVNGSGRVEYNYVQEAPPGSGIEDGATNLEGWFDLRAFSQNWDASARLRVHESSRVEGDPSTARIDRRHLAFRAPRFQVLAGNYYTTLGNGLILRAPEQRFVTLNRMDRAFNLDRRLDGIRVTADTDLVRAVLLSGNPARAGLSSSLMGGTEEQVSDDLLQGGEVTVYPRSFLGLGFGYVAAELTSPDQNWEGRAHQDLVSYRIEGTSSRGSGRFEYAELRPGAVIADAFVLERGVGRYLSLEGTLGPVGVSAEWKSYRRFQAFPYHQPPTLVRTHESVLLNRSTHVVNLEDEHGIQIEATWASGGTTEVTANVTTADDREARTTARYREVFAQIRTEREGVGAGRLDVDWSEEGLKLISNRWTAALELEGYATETYSVILDAEVQSVTSELGDHTNLLGQLAVSRAGSWTAALTAEHTTDPFTIKDTFVFASIDLRLHANHDLTLGYGSRPAGLVCSGGFCFESPQFEGAEFRLLSRF